MNAAEHRAAAIEALSGSGRLIAQLEDSRQRLASLLPVLLQDLVSRRLIPAFLALGGEVPRDFSFRHAVDRVARLGGLVSGDDWMELTTVRNQLAHDYPVDLDQFLLRLDDAWSRYDQLIVNARHLIDALKQRGLA